jgi:hypothetical protein
MKKAHLTMPAHELRDLAEALLPAMNEGMTPVLGGALVYLDGGRITAVATDRYRVHRVRGTYEGTKVGMFLIPLGALKWAIKNASFFGRYRGVAPAARLDFSYEEAEPGKKGNLIATPTGTVMVSISEGDGGETISYTLPLIAGHFPAVENLLARALNLDPVAASAGVNLKFLSDAQKLAEFKGQPGEVRVVPSSANNKAPTMLVIFDRGEALIQMTETAARA